MTDFDRIFRLVMDDPALMRSMTAAQTEAELFALVAALGRDRGIEIDGAQLAEIVRTNRRAWVERWLAV